MSASSFRIFDQMLEGVQVVDEDCRYVYINDAALLQSKKQSRSDLIGKLMSECYPGIQGTPLYQRIKLCLNSKVSQEWINEFNFPDGSKGFFQLRIFSIDQGALIMSFDVTEQQKAERIVKGTNEYLESMVKIRTDELLQQNVIIENQLRNASQINSTRDRLFGIVAHDLIAPLQTLRGLIDMISRKSDALTREEFLEAVQQLQTNVQNAKTFAENLVLWARSQILTSSQPQLEKILVLEVIEEVVKLYQSLADKKGIELIYDVENNLFANADKHQLSFIVRNLVNNAIKFTPGGAVNISANERNSKVHIHVSDNGIGMSSNMIEKIKNSTIDRSIAGTLGERGTGLGLLLCFEFVSQNNGNIEIESIEGKGSTFRVIVDSRTSN